ncbi:aminotransferase class I/II-fold pyridoxal phosphate-dependent enzyme [Candidatus Micrarchaeota archaeon]|nr:aminotransferase class I/II-fold pyridoxal phosphate-dependent enzyme [Candidatus Micrarchaeota archaeon]
MGRLRRAELAFANDIRGGPEKSMGALISRLFARRDPLDLSSGDAPKCLGKGGFRGIDHAIRGFDASIMAYDHPLYSEAQRAIWNYVTGLNPRKLERESARVHVINGISPFMDVALRVSAEALGFWKEQWHDRTPIVVIIPPIHPHWLATIIDNFGYSSIKTIKRLPNGLPDMDDMERVFREIDRPFIVIATPDENPSGVCTPNSVMFNDEKRGLIDHIRNHTRWGILLLDAIYMDSSWGENAAKRTELIKAIEEAGVRTIVMHSLSKIFRKPGLRIGGAAYVGPIDDVGFRLLTEFRRVVDGNIKNGIPSIALPGLIEAYSGKPQVLEEVVKTIERIRKRVETNLRLINSGPVKPAFRDGTIETAFYGLHTIGDEEMHVPWRDPLYQNFLVDKIEAKLDIGAADIAIVWRPFRKVVGEIGMRPSRAFAIELAMNGLMVLPHVPFYPMFLDDGLTRPFTDVPMNDLGEPAVSFRTILAHKKEVTQEASEIIQRVWGERTDAYRTRNWRDAYK